MIFFDGEVFDGEFVDGKCKGVGSKILVDGFVYEGEFKNDLFWGEGIM